MAFTTYILTVSLLIAACHGGFVWQDDKPSSNLFGRFPFQPMFMYGPPLPAPPPLPKIPGFDLPQPPPLPFFNPSFFPTFQMPTFPPLPTVNDIKNTKPLPGEDFNGVYASSHSNSRYDKDGKLIRNGGGTILVNNNGEVYEKTFGDYPSTDQPNAVPMIIPMPIHMPPMVMPPFPQHVFKPIDPDFIRNAVPKGPHETFTGSSTSSHSFYSDDNGVKTSGGGVDSITNDNGKVEENQIEYTKNSK